MLRWRRGPHNCAISGRLTQHMLTDDCMCTECHMMTQLTRSLTKAADGDDDTRL